MSDEPVTAEPIVAEPMPREFDTRRLARRAAGVIVAIAVLILIALLAPGLGEVRALLKRASPGWLAVGVVLEVLSCLSYVLMFKPVFCTRMSWRSATEIGLSELAVGSIVPASGAGGIALGAWILSRYGMPGREIARRSIAFLLLKSSINFVAVAVIGFAMALGVGPHHSLALTLVPAVLSVIVLVGLPLVARRIRRGKLASIGEGVDEAGRLLREHDWRLVLGATGYWLFDNLVLLAAFAAFGAPPPLIVVLQAYLIGQIGGALPIPGGIGGIDGGLIGMLVIFGVGAAPAAAAVLLYRVILFWVPLLMGIPAFLSLRRGLDDRRRPDLCLPLQA